MITATFRQPFHVNFIDRPAPTPGRDEVVVSVDACGVCAFERKLYAGAIPWYPVAPGHEVTGVVAAVGDSTLLRWIGTRVIVDLMRRCGLCGPCRAGHSAVCTAPPHTLPGGIVDLGHGFSDQLLLPLSRVRAVPQATREEAVLAEPLACVVHAIRVSGHEPGQPAAVVGGGVMAGLFTLLLRHMGTPVTVVSPHVECRRICESFGARASQEIPDGQATLFLLSPHTGDRALVRLQPGGRLVIFTDVHSSVEPPALSDLHQHGCALIGSYSHEPPDWDTTATLLQRRLLQPAGRLIGDRVPMSALPDALAHHAPGKRTITINELAVTTERRARRHHPSTPPSQGSA